MSQRITRLGVIGCGGFAQFAVEQFLRVPGVQLSGIADSNRDAAGNMATRFCLSGPMEVDQLLAQGEIDLVYVATPPFLHHPLALQSLTAGKHVICEKPLALSLAQADEMIALAQERDLLLIANLMQRYNPLADQVKELIDRRLLGEVLHGSFENLASDENLLPGHWFWDRTKSGGIFIEHGVHFFDLFARWLGPGRVVAAQRALRPSTSMEEQVSCTVRYGAGTFVNFYHGFHQPVRMDRQQLRLIFERGDVTLHEWVPARATIHALVDEDQERQLRLLFPGNTVESLSQYSGEARSYRGRNQTLDAGQRIVLTVGAEQEKTLVYQQLLRNMLEDQLAWLDDRTHPRRITAANGRDSLAAACAADAMAAETEGS